MCWLHRVKNKQLVVRRCKPESLRGLKTPETFTSAVTSGLTKAQTNYLFSIIYLFILHTRCNRRRLRQQPVRCILKKKKHLRNILRKSVIRMRLLEEIKCWFVTLASLATVHARTRSGVQQRNEVDLKAARMAFKTIKVPFTFWWVFPRLNTRYTVARRSSVLKNTVHPVQTPRLETPAPYNVLFLLNKQC